MSTAQASATAKWRLKNPEKVREAHRIWSAKNRDKRQASNRKWQQNNADQLREIRKNRLAKLQAEFESGNRTRASHGKCSLCKQVKPADEFYLSNNSPSGLHGWCKPCSDRKTVENGRKRLGIDPIAFAKILYAQGSACGICGSFDPKGKVEFALDHDHKTGRVRGILCHHCNPMLGLAQDNIEILRAAISYLERSNKCEQI